LAGTITRRQIGGLLAPGAQVGFGGGMEKHLSQLGLAMDFVGLMMPDAFWRVQHVIVE
jgi:hypothetical protein